MGRPILNQFTDGSYTRGADVYTNDGAILSEFLGNCEPLVNVAKPRSYRVVNGFGKLTATAGESQLLFAYVVPRATRLVNFSVIAAARESVSDAGFYTTGHAWGGGGAILANKADVWLQILDHNGKRIGSTGFGTKTISSSRDDMGDTVLVDVFMPVGSVVSVYGKRHASCNAGFLPVVAANLTFLEEHI